MYQYPKKYIEETLKHARFLLSIGKWTKQDYEEYKNYLGKRY